MTTHPHVRTFKARRGRTTRAQRVRLEETLERFGLPDGPVEPARAFGRTAPLVLEVGCGLGHAALAYAGTRPDHDLIAVDVHTPGVALLASRVEAAHLTNVRLVEGDALDLLGRLPAASLHAVHLFFPDPWPKRAHHKRRIVRADVVAVLTDRLVAGGRLLFASDDPAYAAAARQTLEAHPALRGGASPRPAWRPVAGYEAKALREGATVVDLAYERA
jgi:tRNA (guanine-N7-)-methyltransferase